MRYLRQGTQTDVLLGPVISATDFVTPKTDLAYNATGIDVDVFKNATKVDVTLANSAGNGYWRYADHGFYAITLSTTDTDTLGRLKLAFAATGYLIAWSDYTVLPASVYDAMISGTDNFDVNVSQWLGSTAPSITDISLSRKLLSNKTVESANGSSVVVYDDDGVTELGTFTWDSSTRTRGKLT